MKYENETETTPLNTATETGSDECLNLAEKGALRFKQRCDDIWHECDNSNVRTSYKVGRMVKRLLMHPNEYGIHSVGDVAASIGEDPESIEDVLRLTVFTTDEIWRYCDERDGNDTESISILAKITDDATRALFFDRVADGEFSYGEELEQAIDFHERRNRDCA